MNEFLLLLGMMAATFSVRYASFVLVGRAKMPDTVFNALRYVPIAVLSAIIMPMMVLTEGRLDLRIDNAYLVAGLFSIGITLWKKNLLLTIVAGIAGFLLWRMLFA